MGVREAYQKFFNPARTEDEDRQKAIVWARGIVSLWDQEAFKEFVKRIEGRASEPVSLEGDHAHLTAQVARTNAYREIVKVLHSDLERARRVLDATYSEPQES